MTALLPGGRPPAVRPEMAEAGSTLQVELDVRGATCLLTLRGVLCGGSLGALAPRFDQLGCLPCEEVVVDMGQVTQLDQAGAKVILGLYYYVLGRGGALRITGMAGQVAETLCAAGAELEPKGGAADRAGISSSSLSSWASGQGDPTRTLRAVRGH